MGLSQMNRLLTLAIAALFGATVQAQAENYAANYSSLFVNTCLQVIQSGADRNKVLAQQGFAKRLFGMSRASGLATLVAKDDSESSCVMIFRKGVFPRRDPLLAAIDTDLLRAGFHPSGPTLSAAPTKGLVPGIGATKRAIYIKGSQRIMVQSDSDRNAPPSLRMQRAAP